MDLGFIGPQFTWDNMRMGQANIKERLDRALYNQEWLSLFPDTGVWHLLRTRSDHVSLLLRSQASGGRDADLRSSGYQQLGMRRRVLES